MCKHGKVKFSEKDFKLHGYIHTTYNILESKIKKPELNKPDENSFLWVINFSCGLVVYITGAKILLEHKDMEYGFGVLGYHPAVLKHAQEMLGQDPNIYRFDNPDFDIKKYGSNNKWSQLDLLNFYSSQEKELLWPTLIKRNDSEAIIELLRLCKEISQFIDLDKNNLPIWGNGYKDKVMDIDKSKWCQKWTKYPTPWSYIQACLKQLEKQNKEKLTSQESSKQMNTNSLLEEEMEKFNLTTKEYITQPLTLEGKSKLVGYLITTYDKLIAEFGEPNDDFLENSTFQWTIKFRDNEHAYIYDWKKITTPKTMYGWHFRGSNVQVLERVAKILNCDFQLK